MRGPEPRSPLLPGLAALALVTVYVIVLLAAERQAVIIALLALAILAVLAAQRLGVLEGVGRSFAEREDVLGGLAILGAVATAAWFHDNHFVLLLVNSVLLYAVATLGLNLQFGYAGVLNFAGASFFGIGAYTSSVLLAHTAVPHLLALPIGGVVAALVPSPLGVPASRTRRPYPAGGSIACAQLRTTLPAVYDMRCGLPGRHVPV